LKVKGKKTESLNFRANPFKEKEVRAGLAVVRFLLEENPDILITKEIGPISFHTLRDNLVEIYKAESGNINEIIKAFFEDRLIKLEVPTQKKE